MPIPLERLPVSVVTAAAWGNASDGAWIEDHPEDRWQLLLSGYGTTPHHGGPPTIQDLLLRAPTCMASARRGSSSSTTGTRTARFGRMPSRTHGSMRRGYLFSKKSHGLERPASGRSVPRSRPTRRSTALWPSSRKMSSQGGQAIIYHDCALSESEVPAMTV